MDMRAFFRHRWVRTTLILLSLLVILCVLAVAAVLLFLNEISYMPAPENVLNKTRINDVGAYDYWGFRLTSDELTDIQQQVGRSRQRAFSEGVTEINQALLDLGRHVFYVETFGNELFMTDVLGIIDGPINTIAVAKAIAALRGRGTTNLRVRLKSDFFAGGRSFKKGDLIDTGIDVPQGSLLPLGLPMHMTPRGIKVGMSCALCHATVDPATGLVVEGVPNTDLNTGLLLAMATNSTAFFTHTGVNKFDPYMTDSSRTVAATSGGQQRIPNAAELEKAVDADFIAWPSGYFDSTIDLVSNPAQISSSFTRHAWPYSWSGFAIAGPFRGLSVFCSNVHAQNSDSLTQAPLSAALFDLDPEVYLATILQNAANRRFRYTPGSKTPSEFFGSVDPTPGAPGLNQVVPLPTHPRVNPLAPTGLVAATPGHLVWEENKAVSAWQNALIPPKPSTPITQARRGKEVFDKAGCGKCHSGPARTNNSILPVDDVGTEPSRAAAFKKTELIFRRPLTWSMKTRTPFDPQEALIIEAPLEAVDLDHAVRGWAHAGTAGGYKVAPLVGLDWSAPYLHDGGVAVGPDREKDLGIPGTFGKGIMPSASNSLLAMIDRKLRALVLQANQSDPSLARMHITGQGHAHWADAENGYNELDQQALIDFLLTNPEPQIEAPDED